MKITLSKRIGLLAFLLPCALALSTTVHAETNKLVIESGDSAQSRQHAAMEKEQWNDTRNLRQKVNKRTEKEWDEQSANINAYWEPNTLRCVDRRTGRVITP
ncbi:DUF1283 family protein [Escherichia coli]|uniref:DUF1283 family protein n=1 Tax=Escherichia coli TaxID=562 RepID=UPI001F10A512|nr:DUF1283 family protein [Escherichia coli]UMR80273.1 DUF1283 domain-containing protein [Escherichia coli]